MEVKEKEVQIQEVIFKVKYLLKEHLLESGVKYFPSVLSVEHGDIDLRSFLDNNFLEYIRVLLYKENNNISV